jgi:competence protein ComEC
LRRPIVFYLLAFAGGILFQYATEVQLGVLLLGIAVAALLSLRADHRSRRWSTCIFLGIFLMGALNIEIREQKAEDLTSYINKSVIVQGYVKNTRIIEENYCRLELKTETLIVGNNQTKLSENMLITISGTPQDIGLEEFWELDGRRISVLGLLTAPPGERNPGLFDYSLYLKTLGIRSILQAKSWNCTITDESVNLPVHYLAGYKQSLLEALSGTMEPEAFGMLAGILFGEKAFIEDDTYLAFQMNGAAHILSVSGLHIAVIFAALKKIMGKDGNPAVDSLILVILIAYAALSSFSSTVVRAVFMIAVFTAATYLAERYDLTCCAAFTALVLLLYNPYNIFGLGFQLSYLAVFTLSVILPYVSKWYRLLFPEKKNSSGSIVDTTKEKLIRYAVFSMLTLTAIQIGMIPVTAYVFNYFSISAFVVNAPVIILSSIILPLGLLLMLLMLMHYSLVYFTTEGFILHEIFGYFDTGSVFIFKILAICSEILIDLMIWINKLLAVEGIGYFYVESPSAPIVFIYYIAAFLICSEMGQWLLRLSPDAVIGRIREGSPVEEQTERHTRNNRIVSCAVAFLLLGSIMMLQDPYKKADLVFLDVGQGDSLYIRTPKGKSILIDGGGSRDPNDGSKSFDVGAKILLPFLLKRGTHEIDLAIVTHLHDDHFKGIESLSKLIDIKKLALFVGNKAEESTVLSKVHMDPENLIYVKCGDRIQIEKDIYIDIFYPDSIEKETANMDENAVNLVMRLDYFGTSILMTGDLTGNDELRILESNQLLQSTIIKVPHHGSKNSNTDAFIKAVNPTAAIIQVGKNNFGHPHQVVLDKYSRQGIIIWRTDISGAVLLNIEKDKPVEIMTMDRKKWATFSEISK